MEVSQFTYFQQVAGFECAPVAGELTYGLERLACYLQGVDSIMELNFNGRTDNRKVMYRDVFLQAEEEYSRHNFEFADTDMLFRQFGMAEEACRKYLDAGWDGVAHARHLMALPAYDQCIKASHVFNLLDARGVISVTERQSYILRVRELAKACGEAWLKTAGGGTMVQLDPTQAPPGKHTTYAWHVMPLDPDLGGRSEEIFSAEFADAIIETWARYCPNMTKKNIIGSCIYTARDYTRELINMREGDIFMGAFNAEQVMYNHFGYRSDVPNLYMAGSPCHPGGAISGGAGYIAAGLIARDLGIKTWWQPWDALSALTALADQPVSASSQSSVSR